MRRATKVLTFSVPSAIARQIEQTAREERKTKNELFTDMWQACWRIIRQDLGPRRA